VKSPLVLVAAITLIATVAAGCGGGDSSSLDSNVADAYVEAQAEALCVVQTNAYPTQAEQEAAYKGALQSSTLSEDELAQAQEAAAGDEELRTRISDEVDDRCG
jgi:hypothetical protein